jgi:hypothetical protein
MGLQGNLLIYIYILTVESFSIVDCNWRGKGEEPEMLSNILLKTAHFFKYFRLYSTF